MKKLVQGIVDFREKLTKEKRALFAKLAIEQKPDALFIACSDSRVVPNLFASTDPGDLFVLRNIGNFVPPFSKKEEEHGTSAVLEFSIMSLQVSDIVVCGHSECGAMKALSYGENPEGCSCLTSWLQYGEEALERVQKSKVLDLSLSKHNQVSQANVLLQIEHVMSYPFICDRVLSGQLRIHGWWFDIAKADIYCYEEQEKRFVLIDENEAKRMLARVGG